MKTRFLLALCLFGLTGCAVKDREGPMECRVYAIDLTDTLTAVGNIDAPAIYRSLAVTSADPLAGADVLLTKISDMRYTQQYKVSIPSTSFLQHVEFERKDSIESFKRNLERAVQAIKQEQRGKTKSHVFFAIFNRINSLADCGHCHTRKLYIVTDARENTGIYYSYTETHTDSALWHKLDSAYTLHEDAKTVEVIFVHISRNHSEDDGFHAIATSLIQYLQNRGISARISPTVHN